MEIVMVLILTTVPVAYVIWDRYFRILPLRYFGLTNVQRVAKWESPEWREQVFKRQGMTSHEWIKVNMRQQKALEAELHRRGL